MINNETIKNAVMNAMMKDAWNNAPTMIHEKDYKVMNCVLCNAEMKTIHDTHNPFPLTELCYSKDAHEKGNKNRCCSECNKDVFTARLKMMNVQKDEVLKSYSYSDFIEGKIPETKSSIFETPEAQKKFDEFGQDFYATEFGKQYMKSQQSENA